MRPWKRVSKSVQNFEQTQPTVGASSSRGQSSSRTPNWTECMDSILLGLLREEHTLGININGTFTNLAWNRVVKEYNTRNNMDLTKDQIKNKLKVLKRTFALYNCLANKSGWGWDYENNIPTPGDNEDWQAIIADNPTYMKCRDKPFPQYTDLEFLTQKQTATGRYGFTSVMELPKPSIVHRHLLPVRMKLVYHPCLKTTGRLIHRDHQVLRLWTQIWVLVGVDRGIALPEKDLDLHVDHLATVGKFLPLGAEGQRLTPHLRPFQRWWQLENKSLIWYVKCTKSKLRNVPISPPSKNVWPEFTLSGQLQIKG